MKWETIFEQTVTFKRPKVALKVFTFTLFLSVSTVTTAQQEVVISGRGFDPLLNYSGVPDQVYEVWQGTAMLDVDTSDTNGDYELIISYDEIINSTGSNTEYKISNNYPEPYADQTKIDLVIPDNTTIKIDIFNILGEKVGRQFSFSVFPGNFWMDIKGLYTNGIYFVRVTSTQHSMVEKIIRMDQYSNISPSQLNKQISGNSYNEPSVKLTEASSIQSINKVMEELTIKVRSIGLVQYKDDEVLTNFASQILHFVRIRI